MKNIDLANNIFIFFIVNKKILLPPTTINILKLMGEQIKLAILRRNLSVQLVIERANISRATLWSIETGSPSVVIG